MSPATRPELLAFPIDGGTCQVWCPNCVRWHTHGYDGAERRCWTHRVAHCTSVDSYPHGYYLKLAPRSTMDEIRQGAEPAT